MASDEEILKRRYREFVDLFAADDYHRGPATSEGARHFSPEQMEVRGQTLLLAYKLARR